MSSGESQLRVRIGIDVGGTFTHAVAIDARAQELVGRAKVPTTHDNEIGVAAGVVQSLLKLMDSCDLRPEQVLLIAHSTTQATNALLEGDVAPVGIVGMGSGLGTWLARKQTRLAPIRLAPKRLLRVHHRFIHADRVTESTAREAIAALRRDGAEVIVAAEAFSVDDAAREQLVCDTAAAMGMPATATHHVSRLHGLGIRTRTAVINASMIPRMLSTATRTEQAVRQAGIAAPLMIMRSDGGVMGIDEMRRRPILTMLSGPAAGVAAALLYARVSDGIFLEVGGTSTDISVIKNGRCQIRTAEIGGQKLHVSTLDVRTIGIAGGSMAYADGQRITQVGPRSAHIAGLPYLSFSQHEPAALRAATHEFDGDRYAVAQAGEQRLAVTPTCASNLLGLVPEGDPARGKIEPIRAGFAALATAMGRATGERMAEDLLDVAAAGVVRLVEGLIRDYKLDRGLIRLIGGGGGASAIVPYVARKMGLPHENAPSADVISAIGVALALVRDSIERTVISPSDEDIRRIREEAFESVLRMGAAADTIEVFVEVDGKRNLLRATAEGSTQIEKSDRKSGAATPEQRRETVLASIGECVSPPTAIADAAGFEVWATDKIAHRLWGLVRERRRAVRVLDRVGAVRWASNHADVRAATVATAEKELESLAEQYTRYTDAGATIPKCYVLLDGRIVNLSGLAEMKQVLDMLRAELRRRGSSEACVLLVDMSS